MPTGTAYRSEEEVFEVLSQDPVFQSASPKEKERMAYTALRAAGFGTQTPEQPEVLNPRMPSREYSPFDPYDAGATVAEGVAAGAGAAAGRRIISKGLQTFPHPVPKALGYGLEFLGGLGGATAAGGGAAATRSAISSQVGREDVTPEEAFSRGAQEGAFGEVGARALESLNKLAGRAVVGKGVKDAQAQKDLAEAEAHGIQLRPSEVSESQTAAQVEMSTRRSVAGASKFQELDEKNIGALRAWAEDEAKKYFGGLKDPRIVGEEIQDIIRGNSIPAFRAKQRELYKVLDEIPGIKQVESKKLMDELLTLRGTINERLAPQAAAVVDTALDMVTSINPRTGERVPKGVPFSDMHELRSLLLQIGRDNTEVLSTRVGGLAAHIANDVVHDAMEAAARRGGPRAYQEWKRADKYTRLGNELFQDAAIKAALKATPEDLIKVAFKRGQVTETETIMSALKRSSDPAQALRLYRQGAAAQLLKDASSDGFLDPQRLYNAVYGKTGVGREVMEATFGKRFMGEFDKLLSVSRRMGRAGATNVAGNPSQTSRGMISWAEQGMVLQLPATVTYAAIKGDPALIAKDIAATGGYFLGMDQLARIMNSPRGIEMLRRGMLISPKSQEAAKLFPRILSIALGETFAEGPTPSDILGE
jgi:hypothetical protein